MWRRIPILPILIGTFAGWALLSMVASREQALSDVRVYAVTGALAAAYALVAYALLRMLSRPHSRRGSILYGCVFAWVGLFFVVSVGFVAVMITGRGVTIHGVGPGVMTVIAFSGLGIVVSLM